LILVLVEHEGGATTELTSQALAFGHSLAGDEPVDCVACIAPSQEIATDELGPGTLHLAEHDAYASLAPDAVAATVAGVVERTGARAVVAPGSDTGNDVLARVAARLDQPLASNCVAATAGEPARVTRTRWGGSLLEEAELDGAPLLLTVQPHAVAADVAGAPVAGVERFTPVLADADLAVRVADRRSARPGRRSRRSSTSPAASAAPPSTWPAARGRSGSSRSWTTPRRPSSPAPTTPSSATCTRSCRRSAPS
jgi:electron transfer flavoprotein alpha subunit